MEVVVSRWGNSSGIRLPAVIMKSLHIVDGDKLHIDMAGDTMVVRKKKSTEQLFEEFYGKPFAQITEADIGPGMELEWGEDVGGEVLP